MNGVTFIIAVVLFTGFFLGLSGLLIQSANEVNYREYSDDGNYTNATGNTTQIPDSVNQLTMFSYLTSIGSLFPSVPGFDWLFSALVITFSIIVFIVVIRGVS
ncbi:MAG: hypothetical protein QXD77_02825 [Candidatus Aenigmatarchaeota archaeon]